MAYASITWKGFAPTRYREVVLTVSKQDARLGQGQNHLAVAGGCAALPTTFCDCFSKAVTHGLCLFNLHKEPFELRRVRVRIDRGWRKLIRRRQGRPPFVFGN